MVVALKKGKGFYGGENLSTVIEYPANNFIAGEGSTFIPTAGGRSSVPEVSSTFAPVTKLTEIQPDFAIEWLGTMENLAAYNADIGYALDNIVQLANTDHEIEFSDSVKPAMAVKMKKYLKNREGSYYANSGGIRSLKADLLAQVVINGALSAEVYPNARMNAINPVVRVSPKVIRFAYNRETDSYDPQQLTGNGLVMLNKKTYHYIALRRYFQSPYATPPFIAAVDSLCTQKDMMANFKNIMQKLGMLGFLSAEVSPPVQLPGESQEQYWQKCVNYLNNTVYPQLEKNLGKGFVAGFKDKHEFKLQGNNMNVSGADGLYKLIQSRIYAAVKQDPNMLGENYATTETFGRVILAKMLSQVRDYQQVVDTFLSNVYLMDLMLAGFSPGYVEVKSKMPLVGDKVKDAQAHGYEIDNAIKKRNAGFISQDTAAIEVGQEEAYEDGDIAAAAPAPTGAPASDGTTPSGSKTDPATGTNSSVIIRGIEYGLKRHVPEYDYQSGHICGAMMDRSKFESFDNFKGTDLETYTQKYFKQMMKVYKEATKSISISLANHLLKYPKNAPLDAIQRDSYLHIISKWQSEFVGPMTDVIGDNITRTWEHFRKDKKIFQSGTPKGYSKESFKTVPDGVLDLDDFRAIEYMEASDTMYLGKFITDKDTKKAVYAYLKDGYLNDYLPIGQNEEAVKKFKSNFGETLIEEGWKIRRIIDTTMNKIRNYAHVSYMDQAYVDNYEVIEMNDNLTCDYCAEMDGKVFSVKTTMEKIKKEVSAGPESVSALSPFITKLGIDEVTGKTADELSSSGYNIPPYHPHCRGTIAAVFSS